MSSQHTYEYLHQVASMSSNADDIILRQKYISQTDCPLILLMNLVSHVLTISLLTMDKVYLRIFSR